MADDARSPTARPPVVMAAAAVDRLPDAADVAAVTAAAAADTILIAFLVRHAIAMPMFLICHVAIVLLLALLTASRRRRNADTTMLALATLATVCVGPLGAIGALCTVLIAPVGTGTTRLLQAWYERIAHSVETDPVSQLCDMVAIGRSVDLGGPPPASFGAVMASGSLADRQALLGLIARNFDIEYLPALKIALRSPEPVIRVQAAAVATKVQHALGRIVASWGERTGPTGVGVGTIDAIDALGGIVELEACQSSGLIEAGDRTAAGHTLAGLRAHVMEATLAPDFKYRLLAARAHPYQLPAMAAYADLLIREGRFKALRNWRRLQRAGQLPHTHLRASGRRRRSHAPRLLEAAE